MGELKREVSGRLWSWEALRYRGSGWWIDRILPHSPGGLLAFAICLPLVWFGVGFAITDDSDKFLGTHDVTCQLWFFPVHVFALRVVGGLWAANLERSLDGLALDRTVQQRITRGALGKWASVGALLACAFFICRDTTFGLFTPNADGVIAFDDPDLWDMAELGRQIHIMMLALWCLEWLMFGYLLWLQIWILVGWAAQLRKVDFRAHLEDVLVGDGYRHSFVLFSKTTTVSLVFAIANLAFIYFTGELIPREKVDIDSVGDFLREMSDLLSVALLFVLTLVAAIAFVRVLRGALTRGVAARFADAGDVAMAEMAQPLDLTGQANYDVERLRARVEAQAGLLQAVVFQREVEHVGGATLMKMIMKALVPLVTTALKLKKMFAG